MSWRQTGASRRKQSNALQQGNDVEDEVEENDKLMDITHTKYLKTRRVKDILCMFSGLFTQICL